MVFPETIIYARLGRLPCLYDRTRQKGHGGRCHSCHFDGFGGLCSSYSIQILAIPTLEQGPSKLPFPHRLEYHTNQAALGSHPAFGRWFCRFRCLCENWFEPMVGRPIVGFEGFGCLVDLSDHLCPHCSHDSDCLQYCYCKCPIAHSSRLSPNHLSKSTVSHLAFCSYFILRLYVTR